MFQVWLGACKRAGLDAPSRAYGVRLDDGEQAAAYVAKMGLEEPRSLWDMEHELTKGHSKRARDGETPFDFLRSALAGEDQGTRRLFREFAEAFKGKRQLVWSRGLRELLGLDAPVTDEEIVAAYEDGAEVLGRLSLEQWRAVLKANLRGELLELARHGWGPVERMLGGLPGLKVESG